MGRIKELEKAAQNAEDKIFILKCRRLELDYQNKEWRKQALEPFVQLLEEAAKKEKKWSWLGICYLNTSLQTGSYEFLLSLYNNEFYFDPDPVELYWRPSGFFECFEDDMKSIMVDLRKKYPRIWRYEEDAVRRVCAEYYYAAVRQLCADLADEIMETEAFQRAGKAEDFSAFFGRYQGEGEIIWRTRET